MAAGARRPAAATDRRRVEGHGPITTCSSRPEATARTKSLTTMSPNGRTRRTAASRGARGPTLILGPSRFCPGCHQALDIMSFYVLY